MGQCCSLPQPSEPPMYRFDLKDNYEMNTLFDGYIRTQCNYQSHSFPIDIKQIISSYYDVKPAINWDRWEQRMEEEFEEETKLMFNIFVKDFYQIGAELIDQLDPDSAILKECIRNSDSQRFAMKIVDASTRSPLLPFTCRIYNMNHPNVMNVYDAFINEKQIVIITDLLEGMTLRKYFCSQKDRHLTETESQRIFIQICKGLEFIHSKGVIHRRICPDTIHFVDSPENESFVKIKYLGYGAKAPCQEAFDSKYSAPEMFPDKTVYNNPPNKLRYETHEKYMERLRKWRYDMDLKSLTTRKPYGTKVDMWSIGCVLLTMLSGKEIDWGKLKITKKVMQEIHQLICNINSISKNGKSLLFKLLDINPRKRLSASEALQHTWCSGL